MLGPGPGWSPAPLLHPGLWSAGCPHASPQCHHSGRGCCQLVSPLSESRVRLALASLPYTHMQERVCQSWVQGPTPAPLCVNRPLLFQALVPRSEFIPLHLGVAAHRRLLIAITRICEARCLARPWGRNEDHGVWFSPAGRQGIKREAG